MKKPRKFHLLAWRQLCTIFSNEEKLALLKWAHNYLATSYKGGRGKVRKAVVEVKSIQGGKSPDG